ncbi:MAG: hypothetical protein RIS47_1074 [Bacteroidota bacterium]|jgi:exopolyphosphatase/guanosine-5'-triphosphate,3'-diphosphate pyrophosphatase
MTRTAIIDLGTNTFKLLLVDIHHDGSYEIVLNNKIPVKLAEGGTDDNILSTDAFQRGINALNTFKYNIIDYFEVKKVFAFATAAIRTSENGAWFVDYVSKHIGIDIQIISGEREAELVFQGACTAVEFSDDNYLVCDIGGGSTELIIGNRNEILWKESFRLGASRMTEKFKMSDPPRKSEIQAVEVYLSKKLSPLFTAVNKYPVTKLIGTSGAFSTLARIAHFENDPKGIIPNEAAIPIDIQTLEAVLAKIVRLNHQQRQHLPGIKLIRVKMMAAAAVFINFLVKSINFEEIIFSDYALKEGVISQVVENILAEQNS